jgi:ABC-2 type transport system permease protein
MISALADKTMAIFRRDFLTSIRYRSAFALAAGGTMLELATFYYLAKAIGPGFRPDGLDYFQFLVVGTGFFTFLMTGIHSFLQTVQEAQQNGTFEVLMTTSTPPATLVFLSALSAFVRNIAQFALYLAAGLLLIPSSAKPNLIASLLIFFFSVLFATAIGMMAAALQVITQKGSAVLWAMGSGAWLLTGTLFPITRLPAPLRFAARLIPITHALDGLRLALLQGMDIFAIRRQLAIVAVSSGAMLLLAVFAFSYSVRRARREGTLSSY